MDYRNELTQTETQEAFEIYRGDEIHELPEWLIPAHLRRIAYEGSDEGLSNEITEPLYVRGDDVYEIDEDCVIHTYYGGHNENDK